jgi:hypothetical protein
MAKERFGTHWRSWSNSVTRIDENERLLWPVTTLGARHEKQASRWR